MVLSSATWSSVIGEKRSCQIPQHGHQENRQQPYLRVFIAEFEYAWPAGVLCELKSVKHALEYIGFSMPFRSTKQMLKNVLEQR